jgi:hypothetical protein
MGHVRAVGMNIDVLYSYLIHSSWFFLTGWVLLLLLAGAVAFRHDWS